MQSKTPCNPFFDDMDSSSFLVKEEWEDYIKFEPENTYSPPSPGCSFSEILVEKPKEPLEKMDVENPFQDYDDNDLRRLVDESSQDGSRKSRGEMRSRDEHEDSGENETSGCSRCNSEEEEEDVGSVSTRDTRFGEVSNYDGDMMSCTVNENLSVDQNFDLETEVRLQVSNITQGWSAEEKQYINQIMPHLISSLRELSVFHQIPLTEEIIGPMLKEIIYGKEIMMGAERQTLKKIVEKEMLEQRTWRPKMRVTEEELALEKRKEKKAMKGNINASRVNHLNENYVSNIFQFAKSNYMYDKEVQKIANERNVSASNFRKLMAPRLADDIMTRKAKARIIGSGRELIGNIEYWMKGGYFEQCKNREKYIWHKEKALRDLALTSQS